MVDITTLRPGDVVKIVKEWPGEIGQSHSGNMDKWLGTYMTVKERTYGTFNGNREECVHMVEDIGELRPHSGWFWSGKMIERIISEHIVHQQPILDTDFAMLFA